MHQKYVTEKEGGKYDEKGKRSYEKKKIHLKKSWIKYQKRKNRIILLIQNLINMVIHFQCMKL